MKNNRQKCFDLNREVNKKSIMENENAGQFNAQVAGIVQQQEAQIRDLQAQVANLLTQIQQRPQQQPQQQPQQPPQQNNQFTLTPDQFLNLTNKLRIFNGKDEFTVQEFINTVERTTLLCGQNEALRNYSISIIINDKIQGEAKRCIQRLGANGNDWDEVKRELKLHFRPRKDYAELLNEARIRKVSSLRELFNCVREINYNLNELYEFDENKPVTYQPSNNDKYLADIVSSKIHNFVRGNIPENASIIEIYNKFDKLKLLDDENAVEPSNRRNKSSSYKVSSYNNYSANKNTPNTNITGISNNNNNFVRNSGSYSVPNRSYNRNNNSQYINSGNGQNNSDQNRNNYRSTINNNYNRPNSYQVRQSNNSAQVRNNLMPEPMEIGNLNEGVNFHSEPQSLDSP